MSNPAEAGLGTYQPTDERDSATWARIVDFVAREPQAFSRNPHIGGHVTGSAFVLSPDLDAVLLTHHRKLDMWIQLGGHCDGVADVAFVALKEAYEESGLARINPFGPDILDVDIHEIPARKGEPAHLHYDIRYLFRAIDTQISVSDESHDLAWVPLDGLEAFSTERSLLRMRDRAVAQIERI